MSQDQQRHGKSHALHEKAERLRRLNEVAQANQHQEPHHLNLLRKDQNKIDKLIRESNQYAMPLQPPQNQDEYLPRLVGDYSQGQQPNSLPPSQRDYLLQKGAYDYNPLNTPP